MECAKNPDQNSKVPPHLPADSEVPHQTDLSNEANINLSEETLGGKGTNTPISDIKTIPEERGSEQPQQETTQSNTETIKPEEAEKDFVSIKRFFSPNEYLGAAKEIAHLVTQSKEVFKLVWSDASGLLVRSGVLTLGNHIMPIINGASMALAVSAVETGSSFKGIAALCALVGSSLIQSIAGRYQSNIENKLQAACQKTITKHILESGTALPGGLLDKRDTEYLANAAEKNLQSPLAFIRTSVRSIALSVAVITSSIAVFAVSPIAGAVTLTAGLPILIASRKTNRQFALFHQQSRETYKQFQDRSSNLLKSDAIKESQAIGAEKEMVKKTMEKLSEYHTMYQNTLNRVLQADRFPTYLQQFANAGVLAYCLHAALNGSMSLSQFSFMSGALLGLSSTVSGLFDSLTSQMEQSQNINHILSFIKMGSDAEEQENQKTGKVDWSNSPKIEFRNVSLKYEGKTEYTLKDVSFVIQPGEKVMLCAENGTGKSSLLSLLSGVYAPTGGEILINDIDLATISKKSWQEGFAILSQKGDVFPVYTLRDNLKFGKSMTGNGLEPEVVAQNFALDSKQLDETLGEGENRLKPSGGQGKIIGIARTSVKNPKLAVYDEPTAGLDATNVTRFTNLISNLDKKQTIILVTHDYKLGEVCDRIIQFRKGGEIFVDAPPDQLRYRADTLFGQAVSTGKGPAQKSSN
jgi:ABC-type multidrug transport system fused ATPase/permease subunit